MCVCLCVYVCVCVCVCVHARVRVPQYDAHRARLLAADGNELDCMFVDRRGSPDVHARGNRLVICCEGNAAYYELGLLEVPAKGIFSSKCVVLCTCTVLCYSVFFRVIYSNKVKFLVNFLLSIYHVHVEWTTSLEYIMLVMTDTVFMKSGHLINQDTFFWPKVS